MAGTPKRVLLVAVETLTRQRDQARMEAGKLRTEILRLDHALENLTVRIPPEHEFHDPMGWKIAQVMDEHRKRMEEIP